MLLRAVNSAVYGARGPVNTCDGHCVGLFPAPFLAGSREGYNLLAVGPPTIESPRLLPRVQRRCNLDALGLLFAQPRAALACGLRASGARAPCSFAW
eukprot:4203757-Lingulodinium_polyedra.AAC.1